MTTPSLSLKTKTARVVQLTQALVRASTPEGVDKGAQDIIAHRLRSMGFTCISVEAAGRQNLLALRGEGSEYFGFAGHTDVVPAGGAWTYDPFGGVVVGERLYGRGVADMKGPIAAFIEALSEFDAAGHRGTSSLPIGILIAGDEETDSHGTPALLHRLHDSGKSLRWCLVGEPTASHTVGDCVKIGRRGSLNGNVTITGVQGHVAYPHLVNNPIHTAARLISHLLAAQLDRLDVGDDWPNSTVQVTSIEAGRVGGAVNVVPGKAHFNFNIRYRTPFTQQTLQKKVTEILTQVDPTVEISWQGGSELYDSPDGAFRGIVAEAIRSVTGQTPLMSRDGGTSDGRFIAATGAHVVECGPSNSTIHKVDESLPVEELSTLVTVYREILERVCTHW